MFAETEMESLTSLTIVLIYQMVNREMPMEIRKVRCDSVATGSEKSILSFNDTLPPSGNYREKITGSFDASSAPGF